MANSIDFNGLENNVYDYTSKGGTYFRYNGRSYFVQFPSKVDENTTIFVAGHGNGSNGITHASRMFDATANKNVIVIEPVAVDNMNDFTNIPDFANDIAAHYNISTPNIIMSGHSATGVNALKGGEAVIKATGSPTVVVLSDGHNTHTRVNVDSSVYKDSVVIGLKPVRGANLLQYKNGVSTMDRLKSIAQAGGKVIVCTYSNTTPVTSGPTELDHNASNGVAVALGTYDINSIKFVDSGTVQHRGNTIDALYKYQYLDENGVLHDFNSAEEAQAYLDKALEKCGAGIKNTNTSNYQYYDPNSYQNTTYQLDISSGNNSTLASDLGLVMDSMNDLSGVVKSNSFTKASNGALSTVPLVGLLYDSQNYLFGVSSTLADNIGKESAVIANIAQAIYNMDVQLAANTGGLNGQVAGAGINEALSKILSTDITIPFASFASPVSFEKTTQGHAGKLCLSDLKAMLSGGSLSGSLANGFETDNADTNKTIDSIKAFQDKIASNTSLQGDIWKEVNAKLDNYKSLLDKRLQSNDKLKSAYEEAIKLLEEYMGDYDELDDSKIEELKAKVTQLEAEIEALQAQINQMKEVCKTSEEGKANCYKEYVYSAAARAGFQQQINQNKELIEEFKREIAKLEGLWEVINQAADIVSGAIEEIKAGYANDVAGLAVAAAEQVLGSTNQAADASAPVDVSTNTGTASTDTTTPVTTTTETPNRSRGTGYTGGGGYPGGGTKTPTPTTNNVVVTNTQIPNDVIEVSPAVENTQQPAPTVVNNTKSGGGARPYMKSAIAAREPAPIPVEDDASVITEEIMEEPVIEESPLVARTPTLEEVIHQTSGEDVVMVEQPNLIEQTPATEKSSSLLKAGGVLLGVGLTAGAVAAGIKESQRSEDETSDIYESEKEYKYDNGSGYY